MKFIATFLLLVCSAMAFGQRDTVHDSEGHPSKAILIASHVPLGAFMRRDVMVAPGTWATAPLPPKIAPRATGSTYMALGDIHKVYESVFNLGGCATFGVFNGSIDWNTCTFQVRLITFLDSPLADGTVSITSIQILALGFSMEDTALPLNSMSPLRITGHNAAGAVTFDEQHN
jgi:hypothetical protein